MDNATVPAGEDVVLLAEVLFGGVPVVVHLLEMVQPLAGGFRRPSDGSNISALWNGPLTF